MAETLPIVFGGIDVSSCVVVRCPSCGERYRWVPDEDYLMLRETEEHNHAHYHRMIDDIDTSSEGDHTCFLYFCIACNNPRPMASTVDIMGPEGIPTSVTLLVSDPNCPPS